jgi:hypothetical protein
VFVVFLRESTWSIMPGAGFEPARP